MSEEPEPISPPPEPSLPEPPPSWRDAERIWFPDLHYCVVCLFLFGSFAIIRSWPEEPFDELFSGGIMFLTWSVLATLVFFLNFLMDFRSDIYDANKRGIRPWSMTLAAGAVIAAVFFGGRALIAWIW